MSAAYQGLGRAGRPLYLKYCSACHGPEGKGDGVVSAATDRVGIRLAQHCVER